MSWRSTEYEDLHRIVLPDDPIDVDVLSTAFDTPESRVGLSRDGRTWVDGDEILAVIGVSELWKGVGTVWTLISDRARERGVGLTRGVLRQLGVCHVERGYWRIQATVRRGDEAARLWVVRLGFSYEGTMIAYGPDRASHDMYARLRG